jgi:hypothetical protein
MVVEAEVKSDEERLNPTVLVDKSLETSSFFKRNVTHAINGRGERDCLYVVVEVISNCNVVSTGISKVVHTRCSNQVLRILLFLIDDVVYTI